MKGLENGNIEMNRKELADFLLISDKTLKNIIKAGTLDDKLNKTGHIIVKEYKKGKTIYYELEKVREVTEWDVIQYTNKIKKLNEHDEYSNKRVNGGLKYSKSKIIRDNNIDISINTAKRYDTILQEEGYIIFDKEIYMLYDKETGDYNEITEVEYKQYWLRNRYANEQLSSIKYKKDRYMISENDYDSLRDIIITDVGNKEGTIVMKFDTYIALEKSKKLIDMINKSRSCRGETQI